MVLPRVCSLNINACSNQVMQMVLEPYGNREPYSSQVVVMLTVLRWVILKRTTRTVSVPSYHELFPTPQIKLDRKMTEFIFLRNIRMMIRVRRSVACLPEYSQTMLDKATEWSSTT